MGLCFCEGRQEAAHRSPGWLFGASGSQSSASPSFMDLSHCLGPAGRGSCPLLSRSHLCSMSEGPVCADG